MGSHDQGADSSGTATSGTVQAHIRAGAHWAEDHWTTIDGLRVRYRRVGRRGGTPLVLLNGIGAALEMWAPLVSALDDRDVIALDLPGSGRSQTPRLPAGMTWYAQVVVALLDELEVPRADVLGFSFGGAVAQQLAYDQARRVRRLVLASTTPGMPAVPGSPLALLAASTPLRYLDPTLGALLVPHMVGGRTYRDRAVLHEEMVRRQEQPPTWWGYTCQLSAIATWTSNLWLRRLSMPTLVLHGDDDRLCPAVNARWMASQIPRSRYVQLPGAGHMLLLDESATAAAHLVAFLDEAVASRPAA